MASAMLPSMHLLEAAPTATMWMHLGSVIGEIEHYEHAWTLSNQHLARAKLKLGSKAMAAATIASTTFASAAIDREIQ